MEIKLLFKPFFALFFLIAVSFSSYGQNSSEITWSDNPTLVSNTLGQGVLKGVNYSITESPNSTVQLFPFDPGTQISYTLVLPLVKDSNGQPILSGSGITLLLTNNKIRKTNYFNQPPFGNENRTTLTFSQPITNPVLFVGSLGKGNQARTVTFYGPSGSALQQPIEVLGRFQPQGNPVNYVINNNSVTANEGLFVVQLTGTYTEIAFDYGEIYGGAAYFYLGCAAVSDTDGDGINDDVDNCPDIANVDQADNDADGIGDVCDPDDDNDGVLDTDDNCPFTANVDQADNDGDGLGDICDDDDDNDGILDINDNCPLTANADQADNDADGIGDVCDPDDDNDGVLDVDDNCALIANSDQLDSDGDGMGDVCDNCPLDPENDIDGDGVCGDIDNCPAEPNGDQADSDCDGVGDVCDICPGGDDSVDNNNDGIPDCSQLLAYEDYSDEWKCGKKKQKKILIVHIPPGHPENAHEICISYNALPAHIANHGDFIGTFKSCDNSKEKSAIIIENDIELYDSFNVNVYPNPASSEFNLKVSTDNKVDKVDVQVMDIMGKQVHFNTFDSNKLYKFGESLETGIYFIRITQGEYSKNLKVIKKLN